jgi:hypothetical protein
VSRNSIRSGYQPTASRQSLQSQPGQVRQTVWMQQPIEPPSLPGGMQFPGASAAPSPPNITPAPNLPTAAPPITPAPVPRELPLNPGNASFNPAPISGNSDYAPVAPPQLTDGFATIDNCNCVSAPSSYTAASSVAGCAPVGYQAPAAYQPPPQAYVAPPASIAAPAILPDGALAAPTDGVPRGALISFGQQAYPVQVGQGLYGQPVAYVPGQRFRNWIRYIFP